MTLSLRAATIGGLYTTPAATFSAKEEGIVFISK